MYKGFILAIGLIVSLSVVSFEGNNYLISTAHAAEDGGMAQVRLVLKKLRGSMASMKDFDELEDAGMDKKDVNRMRSAMTRKIKQMTGDAVDLISAL